MTREFHVLPLDDDGEHVLYRKPTFAFDPGVTLLVGCNGSGKTTLMRRMTRLLKDEGVPCHALMRGSLTSGIDMQSQMMAALSHVGASEGEGLMSDMGYALTGLSSTIRHDAEAGCTESWVLIDGIDSSQSEDRLDEVRDLFDAIIETAPEGLDVHVIASANQFGLARGMRCVRVTDAREFVPRGYDSWRRAILTSARWHREAPEVDERAWERTYQHMTESTRLVES